MKAIKVVVALAMGLFSGFLIYLADAILFTSATASAEAVLLRGWAVLIGGWAVSVALLWWRVRSLSQLFRRGLLLGAAGWLAMIPVGTMFRGTQPSPTTMRGVTIAALMAVACLVGFAVVYLVAREKGPEASVPDRR